MIKEVEKPKKKVIPIYSNNGIELYNNNCADVLPDLKDIGLIITDPPWNLNGYNTRIEDTNSISDGQEANWFKMIWAFYASWLTIINDINLMNCWFFIGSNYIAPFMRVSTILDIRIQSIFIKHGKEFLIHTGPEPISLNSQNAIGNRYRCMEYTNRKSLDFIKTLVYAINKIDGRVLDPFAGEGSTLKAVQEIGFPAVGIEFRKEHCDTIMDKLSRSQVKY